MSACGRFEDQLALLAGGDLPHDETSALRLHLPTCETCRRTLVEFREAMEWAKHADAPAFDERDLLQLRRRVTSAIEGRRPTPVWWRPLLGSMVAAAALVAVAWVSASRHPGQTVVATLGMPDAGEEILLANAEPLREDFADPEMPAGPRPLKIEMRTQDPKIKIIWLAQP